MQNKYTKLLIIILVLAIVVPQIAMAAWWNPFSWGIWNRIFHFQRTEQTVGCSNLYWFDNTKTSCGQYKEFCGAYMYFGLHTYKTNEECLKDWVVQSGRIKMESDIFPLFSNLKWDIALEKKVEPVTQTAISDYVIKANATINQNQDADKFVAYYNKKLKAAGWVDENNFAADGIKGSQRGYKKGNSYVVLSYNITPGKIISGENEPLQWECPCSIVYTIASGSVINK